MLYPFQDHSEKYGYINAQGKIIIKPCFSYATEFSDGLGGGIITKETKSFFGKKKEKTEFVYCNTKGEIAIRNKAIQIGKPFFEGLAMVFISPEEKWGFIDKSGTVVIAPQFDQEYSSGFSEGLVDVCKNNAWGYINARGGQVIPFEFEWTNSFHDAYAIVKRKGQKIFINTEGDKLKTVKCSIPDTINGGFKEGLAVVKIAKKYGALNTNGDLVIEPIYDEMTGFHNGMCGVNVDGKYGFIDHQNHLVIPPKFSGVSYFHNGVAAASIDNKSWGLINTKGAFVVEPKFDYIRDFSRNGNLLSMLDNPLLTIAELRKSEYYINLQGNIIAEVKDTSKLKELRAEKMLQQLSLKVKKEKTWDKAEWAYDGLTVTKEGAIKPIYFVLKWLKSNELLTPAGIDAYKEKNNLEIGLFRYMVTEEAADFLDRFYKLWYETERIINFQIDPNLEFEGDENLTEYWNFFLRNRG